MGQLGRELSLLKCILFPLHLQPVDRHSAGFNTDLWNGNARRWDLRSSWAREGCPGHLSAEGPAGLSHRDQAQSIEELRTGEEASLADIRELPDLQVNWQRTSESRTSSALPPGFIFFTLLRSQHAIPSPADGRDSAA